MEADELTLTVEDEAAGAKAQAVSTSNSNSRYLASEQPQAPGIVGVTTSIRPHAPRLIAEDPEKRRIVGRPARPPQRITSPATDSAVEDPPPEPALPAPEAPAPPTPVFEGSGLTEVGTLRKPRQQQGGGGDDEDDEFSYALEGGKREEGFHKQVFRPKAMPAHLVSNVKQRLNTEVLQEEEEEEEEEEEGVEEGEQDHGEEEEAEEEEDKQQQSRSRDKQAANSWTTFAVSEGHMESLADESDPAKPPLAEEPTAATVAAAAARALDTPSAEDLPSYKLLQALHVAPGTGANSAVVSSGMVGAEAASPALTGVSSGDNARRGGDSSKGTAGLPPKEHSPLRVVDSATTGGTSPGPSSAAAAGPAAAAAAVVPGGAAAAAAGSAAASAVATITAAPRQRQQPGAAVAKGAAAAATAASQPEKEVEEDEWEAANRERQRERERAASKASAGGAASTGGASAGAGGASISSAPLSYHQALLHFMAMDTSALRPQVLGGLPPPPGLLARLLCLGPPPLRPPLLREQLLQLLALARLPFADEDAMHVRLLGALYGAFTGKSSDPPRYGSHWAELGFQGQDPATDLRGCGMLGLLQLYHLTQWSAEGASKMLRLSQHPVQEFPLAIVSLNVTKWTLQALRGGLLHRAANSGGSMVEAAQQFYAGSMATFYCTWLGGRKTMRDSGHVLKELEALALKKPGLMMAASQRMDLPDPPPSTA